jgi:trehalose 6-phosphate phosphatase
MYNNFMETKIRQVRDYWLLPDALSPEVGLIAKLREFKLAVFLDYDGTLVPVMAHPEEALLSESMRQAIAKLSQVAMVAIVSGRNKSNIEELVNLPNIYYVGNHGFDIEGLGKNPIHHEVGRECLLTMEKCFRQLQSRLMNIPGVVFEPKKLTVTIHYRSVSEKDLPLFFELTEETMTHYSALKLTGGKKVVEIRPNVDWNKGKAVLWLAEKLKLNRPGCYLVYIGDDLSDEDAFRLLPSQGTGILVGNHGAQTYADYHLQDPQQVELFLNTLISELC